MRILGTLVALGVWMTPVMVTVAEQPSWAQNRQPSAEEIAAAIVQLIQQARQLQQQGKPRQALEVWQQVLAISQKLELTELEALAWNAIGYNAHAIGEPQRAIEAYENALPLFRAVQDRGGEAATLTGLGGIYYSIGEVEQAIAYYEQALPLFRAVQDRGGEAATLNNLGLVYDSIGEVEKAIAFYEQALPLVRAVQNRGGEATTLNNLGGVYDSIGEVEKAIAYYEQALPLRRAVQDRGGEATTLSNIAAFYRDTNQPEKAIEHLKQSLEITLTLRSNLKQENRKTFIETNRGPAIALTSLLIEQNQPKEAFTWINRVTTYELADYTRLLGAKVQNPEAQALIDEYNQRSQQLEVLRQQLQLDFSDDQLSRRIGDLETENIQLAEQIAQQFPEAADLFETPLIDIEQLQATIPPGTLVLQPVPLTNITNVPNTLALFLLTRDSFQVVQTPLDAEKFNQLVQRYPQQLENRHKDSLTTSRDLYYILIRPIEDQLNAYNPEHLSIIATGQLRYIPFESLNDRETKQFLIEKYPINYLTRLSPTPSNPQTRNNSRRLLAFGNPKPDPPLDLPGTEAEVNTITQLFRNSQGYLHQSATLDQFKTQAPKFPFLHLATHGCFQDQPCQFESEENGKTDTATLAANTILFADRQWPIQDAALLGLTDTRLIALSACQTAREADLEGNSISGVAYLFERAGAQAVMASLWQAEDRYTKELMSDFYQYITEGMTQAQALRQAKLNQLKHHPHIWSPFILIGDAQSDPLPETGFLSPVRTPVFVLITSSILLIGGFWWLKRGR
ncbi:CHAT domain-containing protein [Roseofilum sp. BLCC_M91]|uniref:CHAT domain-containing protein n=1 Tax=Roseofilum halophilum BLCC-M91 TaxID=3022259 RepID=A0ABT7BMJ7_9CYAN|nr:CHAT domain-containing protein [Roseofilum halophilum]MDJ1180419.1 CHAT domain-containing protein [Roseofilum halophilum BLCC-M91]